MSSTSFGLHVGNSVSCLSVHKDLRVEVVANDAGERVTPAAVVFAGNAEVLTGLSAKQFLARFPRSGVKYGNKRAMGSTPESLSGLISSGSTSSSGARLHMTDAGAAWYEIEASEEGHKGRKATTQEILANIMTNMQGIALSHAASDSPDDFQTVVTVPAVFTSAHRDVVASCADRAGFNVIQVISEPAAACLAYGLGQLDPSERFYAIVFRIGGVGMDVSLVLVNAGFVSVVETVTKDVGGHQVTELIVDYLAAEFQRKYKADPRETKRGRQKLLTNAENVKHILSKLDTANCTIESLYEGIDLNANVTRARFENEFAKLLQEFIGPIREVLKKAGVATDAVEKVILCGGTTKIPKIQKSLSALLDSAEILSSINPDEVIAYGAAVQAGLISEKQIFPDTRIDVKIVNSAISFSLIGGESEEEQILIPRFCPIPVRKSQLVDTAGKKEIRVKLWLVTEGGEKKEMTELSLTELSENCKVSLSAHVHRDGGFNVALTEKNTGKTDRKDIAMTTSK